MNKTTITLLVIGIILLGAGGWTYKNWKAFAPSTYVQETTDANGTTTQTTVNTDTGTSTPGAPTFTMAQVGEHKDASSCYSVISGKVYDLTMWVNMHPGGRQAILSICGTDGTEKFMNQHHGAKRQMDVLARFYIGNIR